MTKITKALSLAFALLGSHSAQAESVSTDLYAYGDWSVTIGTFADRTLYCRLGVTREDVGFYQFITRDQQPFLTVTVTEELGRHPNISFGIQLDDQKPWSFTSVSTEGHTIFIFMNNQADNYPVLLAQIQQAQVFWLTQGRPPYGRLVGVSLIGSEPAYREMVKCLKLL